MRFLIFIFLFTQQLWAAEGAHGFITYLQRCDGPSAAEKKIFDKMNKTDLFSVKRDIYYKQLEKEKFSCLKKALSDYAFKMNPTMKQIQDQREYRVIFTQLALYAGQANRERQKTTVFALCRMTEPGLPNSECAKRMSEQLTDDYFMVSAVERLLTAVGEAFDQNPGLSIDKVEKSIDRDFEEEIRKASARAKSSRQFSLPASATR